MQIIINADDFGLHKDVNLGIIEAHSIGMVGSASLLVNCEASYDAAQLALQNTSLEIGLHFCISSGHCVAPKDEIPTLVDERGRFKFDDHNIPGSVAELRKAITDNCYVLEHIEREFWAQVNKFESFGIEVAFLDIHHYLSLIHIKLFEKYVELANHLAVPFRGLCYPIIDMFRLPQSIVAEMKKIIDRSASSAPEISLSNLLGSRPAVIPSPEEYQRIMEAKLQSLAAEGIQTVELATHPARISDFIRQNDTYVWARKLEMALVNSPTLSYFVKANDFQLTYHKYLKSKKHNDRTE